MLHRRSERHEHRRQGYRIRRWQVVIAPLIAMGFVGLDVGSASAALPAEAIFHMNERSGNVMKDSAAPPANNGTTYNVTMGAAGQPGRAYSFNGVDSAVIVPDADNLDPGTRNFTVTAKVRFTELPPPTSFDIVRKGEAGTVGGEWKLELINSGGKALAVCAAQGAQTGVFLVRNNTDLSDGAWHSLACSRRGPNWILTVDGTNFRIRAPLGSISNSRDMSIGSKYRQDDFYLGLIDEVKLYII